MGKEKGGGREEEGWKIEDERGETHKLLYALFLGCVEKEVKEERRERQGKGT